MNFSTKNPHDSFVRQGFDLAITRCASQAQDGKGGGSLSVLKCKQPPLRDESSLSYRCSSAETLPEPEVKGCTVSLPCLGQGGHPWGGLVILYIQLFKKGINKAGKDVRYRNHSKIFL